jgi:drug/metabolite transporter (DMT)-like permease
MLSVLDIKKNKPFLIWLGITLFCIIFAFVYEMFSFGVYSMSMILMFLYPLLLGALPCLFFHGNTSRFRNDGILLLTGGSLLAGVLEIYGTSSSLTDMIRWLGIIFLVLDLIIMVLQKRITIWNQSQ